MTSMGDTHFISRLAAGDVTVFSDIFIEYYEPLCQSAYAILRDEERAKDVVMDVFTKICDKPSFLKAVEQDVWSYLYRSVRNRSLEVVRKSKKDPCKATADSETDWESLDLMEAEAPIPMLERKEREKVVDYILSKLPTRRRIIFRMYHEGGMTYDEVASALGLKGRNSIKTQLSLAKKDITNKWNHLLYILMPLTVLIN